MSTKYDSLPDKTQKLIYALESRDYWPEFNQQEIDKIRFSIFAACLITAVEDNTRKPSVKHVWFPAPRLGCRELREGNAPADRDRPGWMKGLKLHIDVGEIPDDVWDAVKKSRQDARSSAAEPTRIVDVVENPDIVNYINQNAKKGLIYQ